MKFVSRSIDLYEDLAHQSNNVARMNCNGYMFATRNPTKVEVYKKLAKRLEDVGGGSLRVHGRDGKLDISSYLPTSALVWDTPLDGTDLVLGEENIETLFPHLSGSGAIAALHIRRAGWFDRPEKLGEYWIQTAIQASDGEFINGKVTQILHRSGRVTGVEVSNSRGESSIVETERIVLAAGPLIQDFETMVGPGIFPIPVSYELHARAVFDDPQHIVPVDAPFSLWSDPVGEIKIQVRDLANKAFPCPHAMRSAHSRPSPVDRMGSMPYFPMAFMFVPFQMDNWEPYGRMISQNMINLSFPKLKESIHGRG